MQYNFVLKEDVTPSNATGVHYMSPEELDGRYKVPTDIPQPDGREVFHDNEEKNSQDNLVSGYMANSQFSVSEKNPENYIKMGTSPIDIINSVKADPANVIITRYNDNNYVHYNDIKNYMDASNTKDYDSAVNNIINSNDDESLHNNGLKIVMTKSEFDECTDEEKANLESANVELEIYRQ